MRTQFELLAAVLILVRRAQYCYYLLIRGEGYGTRYFYVEALNRIDDLLRSRVDKRVIVSFELDSDLPYVDCSFSPS